MKENLKHYLIETDVLLEHLFHQDKNTDSELEIVMTSGICFTTVINAAELYFAVSNNQEKEAVDALLKALKILGLNARYSLNISEFFNKVATTRDALICSVAKINKLVILTNNIDKYQKLLTSQKTGIEVLLPKKLRGIIDTR